MVRKQRTRVFIGAFLVASAAIAGQAFAHNLQGTNTYYQVLDPGGVLRCAQLTAAIQEGTTGDITIASRADALKNAGCSTGDPKPAGYVEVDERLLKSGAVCRAFDGYVGNLANQYWAAAGRDVTDCGSGSYTTQVQARVFVNGADRLGSGQSPAHSF